VSKTVKNLSAGSLLFILAGFAAGQDKGKPAYSFSSYDEMRTRVVALYQEKKYQEAADILLWGWEKFPDRARANAYNLALMYGYLSELDKGVRMLGAALDRGGFYGLWEFEADPWAPYRETAGFKEFLARNKARIEEAQKAARLKVEVETPEGFGRTKAYPLFIALHGGGENLAEFKPRWTSPGLRKRFLVAYVQSTQVASMTGFHWQDAAVTKRDLAEAYAQIKKDYPVDEANVILGGFSSGGYGSLVALLDNALPARGFVVLCPPVPEILTEDKIRSMKARGIKGTFLTTEMDGRLAEQTKMCDALKKGGLDVDFIVFPNVGHWYPDDLGARIDAALERLLK